MTNHPKSSIKQAEEVHDLVHPVRDEKVRAIQERLQAALANPALDVTGDIYRDDVGHLLSSLAGERERNKTLEAKLLLTKAGRDLAHKRTYEIQQKAIAAVANERERCAKALCEFCQDTEHNEPAALREGSLRLWHKHLPFGYEPCAAAAIRDDAVDEDKKLEDKNSLR